MQYIPNRYLLCVPREQEGNLIKSKSFGFGGSRMGSDKSSQRRFFLLLRTNNV